MTMMLSLCVGTITSDVLKLEHSHYTPTREKMIPEQESQVKTGLPIQLRVRIYYLQCTWNQRKEKFTAVLRALVYMS